MKKLRLILSLAFLAMVSPAIAQQIIVDIDTLATEVHFRWDRPELDTMYLGNDRVFSDIAYRLDSIGVDKIDSVVIVSQSSPEGPYWRNQRLSEGRAASMRSYMESHHPEIKDRLTVEPDGESWMQLRQYIVRDKRLSDEAKSRLLTIIDDKDMPIEWKKRCMSRDEEYSYLYRKYYPLIRNSQIWIVYRNHHKRWLPLNSKISPIKRNLPPISRPTTGIEIDISQQPIPWVRDTLVLGLKTNLLYDAVTALNFEVELPIGNHWSVAVEDVFPWWEKDNKYCFEMWEMGIEARYWFRNNDYYVKKLQGHFLGAYAMSSKYDFQWDHDLCYQGEYWSAGLTYGYSMKLSRRLNMEFSISVGWLSSRYRHYYPADDYGLLWHDRPKDGSFGFFGPTKLKVALVLPLRIQYINRRGGTR